MVKLRWTWLAYGALLAVGALLLDWLEYQYLLKRFSTELYIVILCVLFIGVGIWLGQRFTRQQAPARFEFNNKAQATLGISDREQAVLNLIALGHSNQEVADQLHISINTVKTHVSNLYQKLGVSRRGQAVDAARQLKLVP